tara:strand:- start:22294 stop:26031 length:3738 start_codon:yes stop_codon:yes gene_type:complete
VEKVYRTKIDFRVLGDEIKFVFFMSGNVDTKKQESVTKRKCLEFTYNTLYPVETILKIQDNVERLFLYLDSKVLTHTQHAKGIGLIKTPLILEVFKNKQGNFGFEKVVGKNVGAFLSHPNYFNIGSDGALKPFNKISGGKKHSIQMVLPDLIISPQLMNTLSFDMDIFINKCGQYNHSVKFKLNIEDNKILKGHIISGVPVKQIINTPSVIKLEPTYLTLHQKDLASRELLYDYKEQLTPQNVESESLELIKSNVYAIQNPLSTNVDLSDLNLPNKNNIEVPYNIARYVEDNEVKQSNKIFKDGKYIYALNWVNEIRDNDIFSSANKCLSLKFSTKQQLNAFTEKLKQQQIGNVETYPTINERGTVENTPRTYSKISQWINRTKLNDFNDVRFTYDYNNDINSILICPKKQSIIGPKQDGNQNGLYTKGNEYLLPTGKEYIGYYHINDSIFMVGKEHTTKPHDILTPLYTTAPISANTLTDFCFSTYNKKDETEVYSGFTATTSDPNTPNKTYDLHLSGSSFSADTIIPISNIETGKMMRLIDDITGEYRPYAFSDTYNCGTNMGSLVFNNNDADTYLIYSAVTDGIYRFTYKAYLNIKYTDTKWCEYLATSYPSGFTNNYPTNDYEIKRLINTAIIQSGKGEKEVVSIDTKFKYNSGIKYRDCGEGKERYVCGDTPANTGILNFNFNAYIQKGTTTGNTGTTLTQFKILRSTIDGTANDYLTLDVSQNDMTSSGANSCILSSVTSSTIFHKQIPIILDTGFINLVSGNTIQLRYESIWSAASKSGFYSRISNGEANIDINVGHKLDVSGTTLECPYYRGIKASSNLVQKKLFFDSTKKSIPFKMNSGGVSKEVTLDGSLYISESECGNILVPQITPNNFNTFRFLDTTAPDNMLIWDIDNTTPSNNWQRMIEDNVIKDYTLNQGNKMTTMKDNGIFAFHIPTYNSDYGAKCDFTFPQVSQSYVIVNTFKNYFGNLLTHYIVVTPHCGFYKPCSGVKVASAYDILHKTTPCDWRVVRMNKKLTIKGKEITIIPSHSHYNPEPEKRQSKTGCRYYCKCGQELASSLNLDPIYGITNIFSDLESKDCTDCLDKAYNYCYSLNNKCKPILIGNCKDNNIYLEQLIAANTVGNTNKYVVPPKGTTVNGGTSGGVTHDGGSNPSIESYYSCVDGLCVIDDMGYMTIDQCLAVCEKVKDKPDNPEDIPVEGGTEEGRGGGGGGVCKEGTYWCSSLGQCINKTTACPEVDKK